MSSSIELSTQSASTKPACRHPHSRKACLGRGTWSAGNRCWRESAWWWWWVCVWVTVRVWARAGLGDGEWVVARRCPHPWGLSPKAMAFARSNPRNRRRHILGEGGQSMTHMHRRQLWQSYARTCTHTHTRTTPRQSICPRARDSRTPVLASRVQSGGGVMRTCVTNWVRCCGNFGIKTFKLGRKLTCVKWRGRGKGSRAPARCQRDVHLVDVGLRDCHRKTHQEQVRELCLCDVTTVMVMARSVWWFIWVSAADLHFVPVVVLDPLLHRAWQRQRQTIVACPVSPHNLPALLHSLPPSLLSSLFPHAQPAWLVHTADPPTSGAAVLNLNNKSSGSEATMREGSWPHLRHATRNLWIVHKCSLYKRERPHLLMMHHDLSKSWLHVSRLRSDKVSRILGSATASHKKSRTMSHAIWVTWVHHVDRNIWQVALLKNNATDLVYTLQTSAAAVGVIPVVSQQYWVAVLIGYKQRRSARSAHQKLHTIADEVLV